MGSAERSFSEGESGGLYVLTLRSHCLEDIALAVDMPAEGGKERT